MQCWVCVVSRCGEYVWCMCRRMCLVQFVVCAVCDEYVWCVWSVAWCVGECVWCGVCGVCVWCMV